MWGGGEIEVSNLGITEETMKNLGISDGKMKTKNANLRISENTDFSYFGPNLPE